MNEQTQIKEGLPPPIPRTDGVPESMPDIRATEPTFTEVFFTWEKLRLAFNAVVIPVILLAYDRGTFSSSSFAATSISALVSWPKGTFSGGSGAAHTVA